MPWVAVSDPLQPSTAPFGVAITTLVGRVSLKAMAVSALVPAVLSMVKVKVEISPGKMLSGPNTFEKVGTTVRVSVAGPLLPADEVRSPDVLRCEPTTELVTSTTTVQLAPAATVPPL